jgi:hypothetical protein
MDGGFDRSVATRRTTLVVRRNHQLQPSRTRFRGSAENLKVTERFTAGSRQHAVLYRFNHRWIRAKPGRSPVTAPEYTMGGGEARTISFSEYAVPRRLTTAMEGIMKGSAVAGSGRAAEAAKQARQ